MMGRGGKREGGDWMMIIGIVAIACMFFAGYRFGIGSSAKSAAEQMGPLRLEEKRWMKETENCNSGQHTFVTKDDTLKKRIKAAEDALQRTETTNTMRFEETEKLDAQGASCLSDLQLQVAKWEEQDSVYRHRIQAVADENRRLLQEIKRLGETRGMTMTLLLQSLTRVRSEDYRLRALLNEEMPEDSQVLEDKLLEMWGEQITVSGPLNQVLPISARENSTVDRTNDNTYRYDASHTDIFMPTEEGGKLTRPKYFGREGTEEVVKGVVTGPDRKRVHSVPFLFRSLYNYALCAYRNKNDNFTYPDNFYVKREGNKTHASDLIDTPLIRFCSDCRRTANSTEFQLACLGDTVDIWYGSRDFWAMRSMIRFHTRFYTHVGMWTKTINFGPGQYVATVYRGDKSRNRRCRHGRFLRHYKWLKKNYPDSVWFPREGQTSPICSPSIFQWASGVRQVLKRSGKKKLYISTFPAAESQIRDLKWPDGVEIIIRVPRAKEPENQVMDMIVLSKASTLIADAYSDVAQVATEAWLLEHEFRPDGLFMV